MKTDTEQTGHRDLGLVSLRANTSCVVAHRTGNTSRLILWWRPKVRGGRAQALTAARLVADFVRGRR